MYLNVETWIEVGSSKLNGGYIECQFQYIMMMRIPYFIKRKKEKKQKSLRF